MPCLFWLQCHHFQNRHAQSGDRSQLGACAFQVSAQICLVQNNYRLNIHTPGCDQGAPQQVFGVNGFRRHHNQKLINIGGKLLGAEIVRAIQQIAPFLHCLNRAFSFGLHQHIDLITNGYSGFFSTWKAFDGFAIRQLDKVVATVGGGHQTANVFRCHARLFRCRMRSIALGWLS